MLYRISHTTTYDYSETVSLCQNLAHLRPRDVPWQRCRRTSLSIRPQPAVLANRIDYFGNGATFFSVQQPHQRLIVTATHEIEVAPEALPDPTSSPPWEQVRDGLPSDRSPEGLHAYQYAFDSYHVPTSPDFAAYARPSFAAGRPLFDAVRDLTGRIYRDFAYDSRATTVATPLRRVFAQRRGVCQDFAHFQIACLRSLGLAARYVSGYLCTAPPPGHPRLIGADATHAWLSVYGPGCGWVDFDPTNDQIPAEKHILLAWGRDYSDVSPIQGVILGGGQHTVRVAVEVLPVDQPEPGPSGWYPD